MKSAISKSTPQATLYFRSVGKLSKTSLKRQAQLVGLSRAGDKRASLELFKSNLPHITAIARDYVGMGLSLLDLVAEGNSGLLRAAARFDADSNKSFPAFSAWWIRHAMRMALATQNKEPQCSARLSAQMAQLQRTEFEMAQSLGRQPSDAELASYLQMPIKRVLQLRTLGLSSSEDVSNSRNSKSSVETAQGNAVVSSVAAVLQEQSASASRRAPGVAVRKAGRAALRLSRQLQPA